jgi:hypothetical protein
MLTRCTNYHQVLSINVTMTFVFHHFSSLPRLCGPTDCMENSSQGPLIDYMNELIQPCERWEVQVVPPSAHIKNNNTLDISHLWSFQTKTRWGNTILWESANRHRPFPHHLLVESPSSASLTLCPPLKKSHRVPSFTYGVPRINIVFTFN